MHQRCSARTHVTSDVMCAKRLAAAFSHTPKTTVLHLKCLVAPHGVVQTNLQFYQTMAPSDQNDQTLSNLSCSRDARYFLPYVDALTPDGMATATADEVEALEAIYCEDEEFTLQQLGNNLISYRLMEMD